MHFKIHLFINNFNNRIAHRFRQKLFILKLIDLWVFLFIDRIIYKIFYRNFQIVFNKIKRLKRLVIKEEYAVREWKEDVYSFTQHYNGWLWNITPHPNYPFLADIIILGTKVPQTDIQTLISVEKSIKKELSKNDLAIHAFSSLDNEGTMNFKFYTFDPKKFEKVFKKVKLDIQHTNIELRSYEERKWDTYTDYVPKK